MIKVYLKFCAVILSFALSSTVLGATDEGLELGKIKERLSHIDEAQVQLSEERMALMENLSHIQSKEALRLILQSLGKVDVVTQKPILLDYIVSYGDFAIPAILEYIEEHPRSIPPVSTAVRAIGLIKGEEFQEFAITYKKQHPDSNAARHLMTWASIDF